MSKEVKELSKEELEKKKKGCLIWGGVFVFFSVISGIFVYLDDTPMFETIDPCKCIKISSKKDLGLSYDESYWNKCVDKYYSVDNLFNECVTED